LLSEEISHKEWRERQLSTSLQTIESRIDSLFANSTEKAMQFAFDGMLANKMLQQAAEWENLQTIRNYESVVEDVQHLPVSDKNTQELLDYLVNSIRKYRPSYDKNAIVNLLICISQGFLTVFSGEPGTGKTSICKIISGILGLNHPSTILSSAVGIDRNRFINISVERGWTTKRDFIGYYNPLTKTFDQANRKVFDGLNLLDIEAKKGYSSIPFFILLDEANLSPMEYYWADYMNVCDDLDQNSNINLGGDYCFRVPSHLRFLATINNDHTTESLSPRLIDRAWIIRLPKVKAGASSPLPLIYDGAELISWKAMIDLFGSSSQSIEPMPEDIGKIYDTLLTKLREARITISTRSDGAIRRYCQIAQKLFETDVNYGNPPSLVALDYAIAQKILPHINGSGEKFGESLKQILSFLNEKNLRYSSEILAEIIQKGDDMMSYYQFFA
jgi:energy-coupling factor transporter ATP-binding protein EcfA2